MLSLPCPGEESAYRYIGGGGYSVFPTAAALPPETAGISFPGVDWENAAQGSRRLGEGLGNGNAAEMTT